MNDRKVLDLLRGVMTPLVAILLLGAFRLGMQPAPRCATSVGRAVGVLSPGSAPLDAAPPFQTAAPVARSGESLGQWLPRLSDQIQRVLYTFPLAEDPEALGVLAGTAQGGPTPTDVADGPLLVAPQIASPAGKAAPEQRQKPLANAAQTPAATSNWPRPPEQDDRQPSPRPLPTVTLEIMDAPRRDELSEPRPLPQSVQAEQTPRPLAAASSPAEPKAVFPPRLSSPLTAMRVPASRSEQIELLAREADTHSRYAFQLASRGAVYAARAELIAAIRLVAQGLDGEERTIEHSRALAVGLTALKEAEDFAPSPSRLDDNLNLASIIASHRTPVLHDLPTEGLTALNAMQHYLTFCQEQLATACGREVAGSMALYGLGKLHAVQATQRNDAIRAAAPKAVALYQASLLVYPRNYMASNDLGVLLARAGRYGDARVALEHSAAICRQEESWQNLAKVYRQLGQGPRAQYAEHQAAAIRQETLRRNQGVRAVSGLVQWVAPEALAQPNGAAPGRVQPAPPNALQRTQNASAATPPRGMSARLPDALFDNRK